MLPKYKEWHLIHHRRSSFLSYEPPFIVHSGSFTREKKKRQQSTHNEIDEPLSSSILSEAISSMS
jgi:hypothetical protein